MQTEAEVTRQRGALEGLGRARMATAGAEVTLRLAEQRLALFRTHRERLLDGNAQLQPAPA